MTRQIRLLFITAFIATIISCRVNKQQVNQEFIKPDQIAFIEYIQTQNGEVLSGTAPQGRRIDGPTYHFDQETKQLNIYRKVNFSIDTIKAILGNGGILKGAAGSGLSLRLSGIGKFPYTMNKLTISEVSNQGLSIIFDKQLILIKEGEKWETSSSTIDTVKMEIPAIIKFTSTFSIRYHGMIDKKSITQ